MVGVIVARFQTPHLHEGHKYLIENILVKHNKCIIVLGVSQKKGDIQSPYDYFTREKMIKEFYPEVITLPIMDMESNEEWSKQLDLLLGTISVGEGFRLYGSRDSFINAYNGKFKCEELPKKGDFNATEIRDGLKDKVKSSEDFRSGILYEISGRFPISYQTVDIACYQNNRTEILLGKKSGYDKWRFPGGFVDPTDKSLEVAAARELHEECGAIEVSEMKYEMSTNIDDWRYRNSIDHIKTALFSCDIIWGTPEAGDDLSEVMWVNIEALADLKSKGMLNQAHLPMFNRIIDSL